jgi:hypothetical protein
MNLHDARAFCLPDGYEVTLSPSSAVAVQAVYCACVLPCVVDESLEASLTPLASSSPLYRSGGGLVVGRREAFVAPVLRPRGDRRPRPQHHTGQVTLIYLPTYVFHDVCTFLLTTCALRVCDVAETSTATTTCQVPSYTAPLSTHPKPATHRTFTTAAPLQVSWG